MPPEFRAAILGDFQVPFHDRDAIDVAQQIVYDFSPHRIVFNGDIWDLKNLSMWPDLKTEFTEPFLCELDDEIDRGIQCCKGFITAESVEYLYNEGNHEWRVVKAMLHASYQSKKLFETKVGRAAFDPLQLFRLKELGKVRFAGRWPKGQWLHPKIPPGERNVFVKHGERANKNAGYTAHNSQVDAQCSIVVNHCHRLAGPLWRHVVGNRDFFSIENGCLSLTAVPVKGEGLYQGAPHSEPDYLNHQQGFSLLTYAEGEWFPYTVRIKNGKAHWNGKFYKSRIGK